VKSIVYSMKLWLVIEKIVGYQVSTWLLRRREIQMADILIWLADIF